MAKKLKEEKGTLSIQEEIFVEELLKDKSQREAYKIAYPKKTKRWKDKTIDSRASELWKESKIQGRYFQLKEEIIKESEKKCIIDATEILEEYKKIAFADIKDYLEYKTEINMVDVGRDMQAPRMTQTIKMKPSEEVEGGAIQEVSINSKGQFTFKLYNKLRALDKLAEYVGLIKPDGAGELREDGLTEQLKKIADSPIWGGFEDDSDDDETED